MITHIGNILACLAIRGVSTATENNSPRAAPAPNPSKPQSPVCSRGPGQSAASRPPLEPLGGLDHNRNPRPSPPSLIDDSGSLCGNSSLPSRESSSETYTTTLGPQELSLPRPCSPMASIRAPGAADGSSDLGGRSAARRGAARLLLYRPPPSPEFAWPRGGRSERVHHQPMLDKHSGAVQKCSPKVRDEENTAAAAESLIGDCQKC